MIVELEFEPKVEREFWWKGIWPKALMDEMGRCKAEVCQSLRPNPMQSDMWTAERIFALEGRRFLVVFLADGRQIASSEVRKLTVFWIEELT